ncbi:MLO-like protein 3 [Citrus sinensis]|uniref:MLO-like protein 3 n=1 Tax=Citrus sinensis TaxID=2711 RepID=A0ACB8IUV4_CITSI|nr:MLO-like protein 3 [Citrus sinensis]
MAAGGGGRTLQNTPTWALATVCFVFIFISIFIEHLIHLLSTWLKRNRKTAFFEAVEKLKSVLIVLGFMSLILTVTQRSISKICIPTKVADTMLPCHQSPEIKTTRALGYHEQFLWTDSLRERRLASDEPVSATSNDHCGSKMKQWKAWERETQTVEYLAANDPNRFRLTRDTTFARRHTSCTSFTGTAFLLWTKCFFQQFFNSVAKVDYLTLRHGFVSAHLSSTNYNSFNFQNYIQRSLEDDFKVVVGISPFMWFVVVIFLLVDVHGWNAYLWVSFIPLTIVLALGTKLKVIVARMAHQLQDEHDVIRGSPLVQPNDNLFWFNRPKFVLTLLHYTLFMWQYGIKSCYHKTKAIIIIRVVLAVMVQVTCSYITLPLYALVTQASMGSTFKRTALEEQTSNVIKQRHSGVSQKRKTQQRERTSQSNSSHENSLTIWSGNRTLSSPDFASHNQAPSLGDIVSVPSKIEITEIGPPD